MRKELVKILVEEERKVKELVEMLKTKRNAIEKGDSKRLNTVLEEEKKVIDEINSFESKRMELTNEISMELETEPTISGILSKMKEPERHDLTIISAKLTELLNEVSLLNMGIQQMIAYKLEEFDMVMDLLRGRHFTYDKSKKAITGTVFNRRA